MLQREPSPFILDVVDPDKDPRLPIEERIDKPRTAELRRYIVDKFGRLPAMAQSVHDQFRPQIIEPSQAEIDEADAWRSDAGWTTCQECARFDFEHGQEYLMHGGAEYLQQVFGGKAEASWLGDWRKYGWCDAKDSITPCIAVTVRCKDFSRKHRGLFLRALGKVVKRLGDL